MATKSAHSVGRAVDRHFSDSAVDPLDQVSWESSDVVLRHHVTGDVVFAQHGVCFPAHFSETARQVIAEKYFRGSVGASDRERSLREVIRRIVGSIFEHGRKEGYFDTEAADAFAAELTWLLVHQRLAFNSPVWFNIGVPGAPQQSAACYILDIEDDMRSILNWYTEEGLIFKGGSGAGVNLSKIRGSVERFSGGEYASGPVMFMRAADASAGTIRSGGKVRQSAKMVLLNADHPDIEDFILCKVLEERRAAVLTAAGYDLSVGGEDMHAVHHQNANHSVRATDAFMQAVADDGDWAIRAVTTGAVLRTMRARDLFRQIAMAAWECADPGMQFHDTINRGNTTPALGPIDTSNPCAEFMRPANSACNLASLNVLAFLDDDGRFDIDGFEHACRVSVTAQDILVGYSDYPTAKIAAAAGAARDIGLGMTNLGGALIALGLPYDSAAGRAWAASVAALMQAAAVDQSSRLARLLEPSPLFEPNRDAWLSVLQEHAAAAMAIAPGRDAEKIAQRASSLWTKALGAAERYGVRNAHLTVAAPTGTISLALDCETTGVEPEYSLRKRKVLVGGGMLDSVNRSVSRGLARLGYTPEQVAAIELHLQGGGDIADAPSFHASHAPVFATAVGADPISPNGHLAMLAALQPHISGALSKTTNLPATATVEDIEAIYLDAWRHGLKAISVYRDGSKVAQPLSAGGPPIDAPVRRELNQPPNQRTAEGAGAWAAVTRCATCGNRQLRRSGTCHVCEVCGSTLGCS